MESKFAEFLTKVQKSTYETTVNAKGIAMIQQTVRNKLRAEGQDALYADLLQFFPDFDCLLTAEGIIFVSHNKDFEFSFQLKATVPSIEYDPYEAADDYAEQERIKKEKKEKKAAETKAKAERQAQLRAEYKAKQNANN